MVDSDTGKARSDTGTERVFFFAEHVAQPVAALGQHLGQQTLDLAPAIVDAFEQQLDVGG